MVIGNTISRISPIEDYIQIFFIDGSILNLYNNVIFSSDYQQFFNETVKDLLITETMMRIIVYDKEITMSMGEKDYCTTEAFAFCSKDEEWIVG